ncbi:hypothetical protein GCM10027160_03030 [Streptomyces calidiresistens]
MYQSGLVDFPMAMGELARAVASIPVPVMLSQAMQAAQALKDFFGLDAAEAMSSSARTDEERQDLVPDGDETGEEPLPSAAEEDGARKGPRSPAGALLAWGESPGPFPPRPTGRSARDRGGRRPQFPHRAAGRRCRAVPPGLADAAGLLTLLRDAGDHRLQAPGQGVGAVQAVRVALPPLAPRGAVCHQGTSVRV